MFLCVCDSLYSMRRRNFLYAGGALACGAGIAEVAGGWNLVQPSVEQKLGVGTLHQASTRLITDGLGPDDSRSYYARLITETPEQRLFTEESTNTSDFKALRNSVQETDFSTSFLLLVEARMSFQNRFGITSWSSPGWAGWRVISIPIAKYGWGEVEPELAGADELITTTIIQYSSGVTPDSGRALLYEQKFSDQIQQRLSFD
jgi:hypothetical protein